MATGVGALGNSFGDLRAIDCLGGSEQVGLGALAREPANTQIAGSGSADST